MKKNKSKEDFYLEYSDGTPFVEPDFDSPEWLENVERLKKMQEELKKKQEDKRGSQYDGAQGSVLVIIRLRGELVLQPIKQPRVSKLCKMFRKRVLGWKIRRICVVLHFKNCV